MGDHVQIEVVGIGAGEQGRGHAGSLPQILRGCGLNHYVFFRPAPGREKDLPGTLFWWESDDGSRVLTSRPPLLVQVEVETANGPATVFVINNHFTSMSAGVEATEPRRNAQAELDWLDRTGD